MSRGWLWILEILQRNDLPPASTPIQRFIFLHADIRVIQYPLPSP